MQDRKLNRLEGFDYSVEGYYIVTICTKSKIEWFGKINNGEITLSEFGKIVKNFWLEIPNHYQNALLDHYIVMPNHIHSIIILFRSVGTEHCSVPTSVRNYGLLSKIIKSFKDITVKTIHKKAGRNTFAWQRSFYTTSFVTSNR